MMRQWKTCLENMLRDKLLDSDPVPGQTLLEWVGKSRVRIENHFGVIQYNENEICVRARQGRYRVSGKNLHILQISSVCLVITGQILAISFAGELGDEK